MKQNNCECSDYSLLTANTGVNRISTANPNLDGTGTLATVFTAGLNGSLVKSILVKSVEATSAGMVRLFISRTNPSTTSLIAEIPVPVAPTLAATPTPAPVLRTFSHKLSTSLVLNAGDTIVASTQNAEAFNVFVEGLDVAYPNPIPTVCCNFKQTYPNIGFGNVSVGNTSLNGSGVTTIFTAAAQNYNGASMSYVLIKALQTTKQGMVRLFISNDAGVTFFLFHEVLVPAITSSSVSRTFQARVPLPYDLQTGFLVGATTNFSQQFAVTVQAEMWKYGI